MAFKPQRKFMGSEGDYSVDYKGPDAIKEDLDSINRMFDPTSIHENGETGGISRDNLSFNMMDTGFADTLGAKAIPGIISAKNTIQSVLEAVVEVILSHSNLSDSTTLSKIGGKLADNPMNAQAIIDDINARVNAAISQSVMQSYVTEKTANLVKGFTYDEGTGVLKATLNNNTLVDVFDLNIEKIPVSISLVESGNTTLLRIENTDGTYTQSDVSNIVKNYKYSFSSNDSTVEASVDTTGNNVSVNLKIASASVRKAHLSADATSYLERLEDSASSSSISAALSAERAETAKTAAVEAEQWTQTCAGLAQSYAIGGAGIRPNEDTENVKVWATAVRNSVSEVNASKEQAAANASQAQAHAASAETHKVASEFAKSASQEYAVLSESYAKGGTNTRPLENSDNALYYMNQAAAYASQTSSDAQSAVTAAEEVLANKEAMEGYKELACTYAFEADSSALAAQNAETRINEIIAEHSTATTQAQNYRNEAEAFRNEASGFKDEAKNYRDQAQVIASGDFIPSNQKGVAGGVASLDADCKVPVSQLPALDYTPSSHATNNTAHITAEERSAWNSKAAGDHNHNTAYAAKSHTHTAADVGAIPTSAKGVANGVATLDTSGKVTASQLPAMDYAPSSHTADSVSHITAEERSAWNNKAAGNHNHDTAYATKAHTHTATDVGASPSDHNHSGVYATAEHAHSNYAHKPEYTSIMMYGTKWASDKTYSFEDTFPWSGYDIEIAIHNTCTPEQFGAFSSAQIAGNTSSNIVKALGEVPTIDIPIIVKVVAK